MNILLINHYAGSPQHGMEYRPFFLAREWVRLGHRVTVLAASFSHLRARQPEIRGLAVEETIEGVRYIWARTHKYAGNSAGRVLNMVVFIFQMFRLLPHLKKQDRPGLVIASSTYPLDIFPAYCLARLCGAKLVFEVHDLWPLSPVELGGFSRRHPFIVAMQIAEDFAYRHADWVVSLLPCAKPHMISRGMDERKFVYIPNGVETGADALRAEPLPEPHASEFRRLRAEGRFVVAYAGSHGLANALDTLLEAAESLRSEPVSFVMIGQGPEKERLRNECATRGLANVIFLSSVPQAGIPKLLSLADTLYLSFQRKILYRFGISPNKLFDYMMAARPVIQAVDAGNDIVGESGCGITIPPEDACALTHAIRELMKLNEDARVRMGDNGRRYVIAKHDYRMLAPQFPGVPAVTAAPAGAISYALSQMS